MDALKLETAFALKVWITTKPVRGNSSSHSGKSSNSSSGSSSSSTSSSSSSTTSKKSFGISHSHSPKSTKGSIPELLQTSVGNKLRKIGSVFSLKSVRSANEPEEFKVEYNENDEQPTDIIIKEDKATQSDLRPRYRNRHQQQPSHNQIKSTNNNEIDG